MQERSEMQQRQGYQAVEKLRETLDEKYREISGSNTNDEGIDREWEWVSLQELPIPAFLFSYR